MFHTQRRRRPFLRANKQNTDSEQTTQDTNKMWLQWIDSFALFCLAKMLRAWLFSKRNEEFPQGTNNEKDEPFFTPLISMSMSKKSLELNAGFFSSFFFSSEKQSEDLTGRCAFPRGHFKQLMLGSVGKSILVLQESGNTFFRQIQFLFQIK